MNGKQAIDGMASEYGPEDSEKQRFRMEFDLHSFVQALNSGELEKMGLPFGVIKISVQDVEEISALARKAFGGAEVTTVGQFIQFLASLPGFLDSLSAFPQLKAAFASMLQQANQHAPGQGQPADMPMSFSQLYDEHFDN